VRPEHLAQPRHDLLHLLAHQRCLGAEDHVIVRPETQLRDLERGIVDLHMRDHRGVSGSPASVRITAWRSSINSVSRCLMASSNCSSSGPSPLVGIVRTLTPNASARSNRVGVMAATRPPVRSAGRRGKHRRSPRPQLRDPVKIGRPPPVERCNAAPTRAPFLGFERSIGGTAPFAPPSAPIAVVLGVPARVLRGALPDFPLAPDLGAPSAPCAGRVDERDGDREGWHVSESHTLLSFAVAPRSSSPCPLADEPVRLGYRFEFRLAQVGSNRFCWVKSLLEFKEETVHPPAQPAALGPS